MTMFENMITKEIIKETIYDMQRIMKLYLAITDLLKFSLSSLYKNFNQIVRLKKYICSRSHDGKRNLKLKNKYYTLGFNYVYKMEKLEITFHLF